MIEDVRNRLLPRLQLLIQYLEKTEDSAALPFFQSLQASLVAANSEVELQELFLILATAAFQPFTLDSTAALLVDEVLALAEQVAHTLSAASDSPH
ncbi:hypothetical protein EYC98_07970 [Halieaceae bacterium IMCC14734]|uniref:Uncharacterized protein n=1 Tax=Candidatus Litorirhabdus singularis TaxID=2518993 RepID=A0ABT3TES4_9GAMM|nr:hypothetical protein [Candidatus Litorirhabdus singularis]MCX2980813.1 hypothetical protein [Candidatus Litorirhabdus singularis]